MLLTRNRKIKFEKLEFPEQVNGINNMLFRMHFFVHF